MSQVYARDLKPECLTDAFMGAGFEEKLKQAEAKGVELVIGRYYKNAVEE